MWESSRMMLPEHREQFLEHRNALNKQTAPLLDEQERERLDLLLLTAYNEKKPVQLTLYDPFGNLTYTGYVRSLNPEKKQLKFKHEDDLTEAFFIETILDVSFNY